MLAGEAQLRSTEVPPVSLGMDGLEKLLCGWHRLEAVCTGHTTVEHDRRSDRARVQVRSGKNGPGLLLMILSNLCTHRAARTHDPEIRSCVLFQLSQPGTLGRYHFKQEVRETTSPGKKVCVPFLFRWLSVACVVISSLTELNSEEFCYLRNDHSCLQSATIVG